MIQGIDNPIYLSELLPLINRRRLLWSNLTQGERRGLVIEALKNRRTPQDDFRVEMMSRGIPKYLAFTVIDNT